MFFGRVSKGLPLMVVQQKLSCDHIVSKEIKKYYTERNLKKMKIMELFKIICPEEYKGLSVEIEKFPDKMNVNGKSVLVFSVLNVHDLKVP